jgi:hypothetical protein
VAVVGCGALLGSAPRAGRTFAQPLDRGIRDENAGREDPPEAKLGVARRAWKTRKQHQVAPGNEEGGMAEAEREGDREIETLGVRREAEDVLVPRTTGEEDSAFYPSAGGNSALRSIDLGECLPAAHPGQEERDGQPDRDEESDRHRRDDECAVRFQWMV